MDRDPVEGRDEEAHARAREPGDDCDWVDEPWVTEAFGHELRQADDGAVKRSLRMLRRAANREGWRHWSAYRAANLSRALRACERVLGEQYEGREKKSRRWLVRARVADEVVVVVELALAPLRAMVDFKKPLDVVVLRPDVLDVGVLGRELRLRPRHRATAPSIDRRAT